MDTFLQTTTMITFCLTTGLIVFLIVVNYFSYKQNANRLNAFVGARMVKPDKARFALAWFIYFLAFYIPTMLIVWIYKKENVYFYAEIILLICVFQAPAIYPYYIVAVFNDKINGATQWGWIGNRAEIRLDEIDKENLARQRLGKKLGITVIHSTGGIKILTLGLSEKQLSAITTPVNKTLE